MKVTRSDQGDTSLATYGGQIYFIPNVNYTILIVTLIEIKIERVSTIHCCKNKGHLYEKKETDSCIWSGTLAASNHSPEFSGLVRTMKTFQS